VFIRKEPNFQNKKDRERNMTTPTKNQIIERAFQNNMKRNHDISTITPTVQELKEDGSYTEAQHDLMRSEESVDLAQLEEIAGSLGYSLKKEKGAYLKSCVKTNMLQIPFDIAEAKKSNVLISGTNNTGKSRLASGICSILKHFDWSLIVLDNSGIWREISDLPFVRTVEGKTIPLEDLDKIIYDLSFLTPKTQRKAVDRFFKEYWNFVRHTPKKQRKQTLIVLEEFQTYGRNSRYSDNLARIMCTGRNLKIRVLGIVVDLALVDPFFIRLSQQRYHGRIGIEENSKRKFKAYYGGDWCRIACEGLQIGDFIYVLNDKIKIVSVPLFETKTLPKPLNLEKVLA